MEMQTVNFILQRCVGQEPKSVVKCIEGTSLVVLAALLLGLVAVL